MRTMADANQRKTAGGGQGQSRLVPGAFLLSQDCRDTRAAVVFAGGIDLPRGGSYGSLLTGHVMLTMEPIGAVRSPYKETAQIPKGLGAEHQAEGVLEVLPQYEAGLTDIEGFSHLYVLWVFNRASRCELLGTPPCDTRPHGVFATRSPYRPNPIGLTVVRLVRRDGCKLHVRGLDMLDGTPILDIKPYLSSIPAEELRRGWLAEVEGRSHN